MGAPAAVVAARFAWVGYKDRIPFLGRRDERDVRTPGLEGTGPGREPDRVDAGVPPP